MPLMCYRDLFCQIERAEFIQVLVNHLANAVVVETNAHDSADKKLTRGMEAISRQ